MQIHLNEIQISDLFFNYEKPALDEYYKNTDEPSAYSEEAQQAVLEDAENFSATIGGQVSATWLVREYFSRL